MERIRLLRNTYLTAYLRALRACGVDPDPLLEQHGIPTHFEHLPGYMLAAPLLHRFIEDAVIARSPGVISTAAGFFNAAHQPNPFSDTLIQAGTLAEAVELHNDNVAAYSPENRFDLQIGGRWGRWRKLGRSPSQETETFCVANLVGHVRRLRSRNWQPFRIDVAVVMPDVLRSLPAYRGVEVAAVSRHTAITLSARQLQAPLWHRNRLRACQARSGPDGIGDLDFLTSLNALMKTYARTGDLNIDRVAAAAGTSRRTLQRNLRQQGASYSDLAQRVRFEVAKDLLENSPELGVTEVGYELGYRDPGSFSRAFKRVVGIPPAAFRERLAPASNTGAGT